MEINELLIERLRQLDEKYASAGQNLDSYLEGLLYAEYLPYWDYIHLDVLLSLQKPRTSFPDEQIFIMYHQITELYFRLVLHEMDQISEAAAPDCRWVIARVERMNRYFEALRHSFTIMVDGMEPEQFLKFRMALLPASGFQSAQYRRIELSATDLLYLVDRRVRGDFKGDESVDRLFEHIYWKQGATELKSGKATLTLSQFEARYRDELLSLAQKKQNNNLYAVYRRLLATDGASGGASMAASGGGDDFSTLRDALRRFDRHVNVWWPLVHYRSAVRYLQGDPDTIAATGGTNWQQYLPPRLQLRIFFPELWSEEEKADWGRRNLAEDGA
ncbi:MAG: tryptophan 2,3-dioxygenase [Sphingomonadales bacterium]|nr:tryptophan 2,3-dioxygenase [Sphingomonadales bacterium]